MYATSLARRLTGHVSGDVTGRRPLNAWPKQHPFTRPKGVG